MAPPPGARRRHVLALAGAAIAAPGLVVADCGGNCSACTSVLECDSAASCEYFDNVTDGSTVYDPELCRSPTANADESESDDMCWSSVLLGAAGACFFIVFATYVLSAARTRMHAKELLAAPAEQATRTLGKVLSKEAIADSDGGTHYILNVEFESKHADGREFEVKAKKIVHHKLYNETYEGEQVEIVYPVDNEARCEIVSSLTEFSQHQFEPRIFAIFSIPAVLGIALLVGSLFTSNCWLGIPTFLAVTLMGSACSHFILYPNMVKRRLASQKVVITHLRKGAS